MITPATRPADGQLTAFFYGRGVLLKHRDGSGEELSLGFAKSLAVGVTRWGKKPKIKIFITC